MDDFKSISDILEFERHWQQRVSPDPMPEIEALALRGYVPDVHVSTQLAAPLLTVLYRDQYGSMISTSETRPYPVTDEMLSQLFEQATRRLKVHLGEYQYE